MTQHAGFIAPAPGLTCPVVVDAAMLAQMVALKDTDLAKPHVRVIYDLVVEVLECHILQIKKALAEPPPEPATP